MIDKILFIAKMVMAVLPFVVLCFASSGINFEKPERSRQYPMPVLSLIYLIVLMFAVDSINNWILHFIRNLPVWITELGSSFPAELSEMFAMAGEKVNAFIEGLNLNFWIFFISNTVIMLLYLTVKKLCLAIIDRVVQEGSDIHTFVAENFYEYFAEKGKWCLLESYVQARSLFKVFYYSAVILSAMLMLLSRHFYNQGLLETIYYPVFGVLIVGELYFYLDGATKREYSVDILGEDEDAYRVVNYSLLRKFLRNLFGDKLLAENTSVNNTIFNDTTNDEVISKLEKSEDLKVTAFGTYMRTLNDTGFDLDHNYIASALDLLCGKSILFNNPFYNDLIPYAFYPMNRMLLEHKKVLVILGRHAIEDDIKTWLEDGINAVTNIPFLWNIGILDSQKNGDMDIGILTRSDVLDIKLHNANAEFLEKVGYVVIIEPSKLISTAQIGLNLIIKKCRGEEDRSITYCLCDKNCDGLVDAMSHILMTSLTEVSATNKHKGTSSYMCWEADNEYLHHRIVPNISRYLGLGTELSFAALKNQVSKTQWFGGEAFPVTDARWIDKQYYYDLMKYSGLPTNQEAMDERFLTSANFWSAKTDKHNYFTVEDEAFNMFEILRNFSTRSKEQGFINVISSEYLLKDYMADNASIFESDAKAIPYVVADYVRSVRNTVLRLVLMMSTFPVNAEVLKRELSLIGIKVYDIKKQLWYEIFRCYADTKTLKELPEEYRAAVEAASQLSLTDFDNGECKTDISLLLEADEFNAKYGRMEHTFAIKDSSFLDRFVSELKSAGYVAEDEKGDKYYLGAELCGHIYQKYLPGQFFTFGGKYYEMRYLTADGHVLVRRAADHITDRASYRQMREYTICGTKPAERIGSCRDISGMKVIHEYADIRVDTPGYYIMQKYNDFGTSKAVLFEGEKSGIPKRVYRNKEILRIELPDGDGKLTDSVRYTVATLFNEIFRTMFAENHAYIAAVTDDSFIADSSETKPLTYSIKAENCELCSGSIYIIEDSQLDLGLTSAVERNLERILGIITDYLDWHLSAVEKSLNPPPEPQPPVSFTEAPAEPKKEKKTGFVADIRQRAEKIKEKIKGVFKPKDKTKPEGDGVQPPVAEKPEQAAAEPQSDTAAVGEESKADEVMTLKNVAAPSAEDKSAEKKKIEFKRKPYHSTYYLLYGGSSEPSCLDTAGTHSYLGTIGLAKNPLKQARDGKEIAKLVEATFKPGKSDVRYCDFCGTEIYGVEYETLSDGRDRCISCGRTAIKTGAEFRKIFEDVKRNMESFFGIKINTGIRVEMVNSKKLNKKLGYAFVPTPEMDGRVLGVAIKDKNGYTLMIENGSPRMASMLTMAHELTHIWQYLNWSDRAICSRYGRDMRLEIYEGMAKWVEIQYAYLINEPAVAKREELITLSRNDEYGRGFLRYLAAYPFSQGTVITKPTPFMNLEEPLDPEFCGPISYQPVEADTSEADSDNGV
ncbi:MAG: hypothetical protein J6C82_07770 [Clostridia bacterium]|nr:hypothetical protein [Clostridia bacterium]